MYKQLSHAEAKDLIGHLDLIVADVRDEESFNAAHIDGAIHLTMATLNEFCDNSDKTKPILVYCYHGLSSQSVAQHLIDQGFAEVYSLIGGFEAWSAYQSSREDEI